MESKKTITAVTLLALGCDMPGSDMTPAAQAELEKAEDIFRNTEFTKQCVALTIAVDDNDNLIRGRRVLGDTAIDIAEILLPGDASMLKLTRKVGRLDLPDSDSPFDEGVCECLQGDYRLASGDRVKRFECAARSSVAQDTSRLHVELVAEETSSSGHDIRKELSLNYYWPAIVGKSANVVMNSKGCTIYDAGEIPRDRCEALFRRGHEVLRETRRSIAHVKPLKIPRE